MKYLDTDIIFTEDGDFLFDELRGDIKVCNNQRNDLLIQTIIKRLQSSERDWNINKVVTSDVEFFYGERSNEAIYELLTFKIAESLLAEGMLELKDIDVNVKQYEPGKLAILINISKKDSSLAADVSIALTYDLKDNRFIPRIIVGN